MNKEEFRRSMTMIEITKKGEVIAHHTTESPMSHYGQAVWIIEDENPGRGKAVWSQGETRVDLQIKGVVGGWLVAVQPDGLLCGIIWSDGSYYAEVIEDRATGEPVRQATMKELQSGKYQVRGTVALFDDESPLGSILG